jgi:biotin-(acetyl-CoA carboxylase) ligase
VAYADFQIRRPRVVSIGGGRLRRLVASLLCSVLLARAGSNLDELQLVVASGGVVGAGGAGAANCGVRPGLKWPNDLVVGEAKLAGLLAEVDRRPTTASRSVVGIGVNLTDAGAPATCSRRVCSPRPGSR